MLWHRRGCLWCQKLNVPPVLKSLGIPGGRFIVHCVVLDRVICCCPLFFCLRREAEACTAL